MRANASRVGTAIRRAPVAYASPLATLKPMRSPVNDPGPAGNRYGVEVANRTPAVLQHLLDEGQQRDGMTPVRGAGFFRDELPVDA